jgi:multisubunit Na+/H+ antiporter MnhC subunit
MPLLLQNMMGKILAIDLKPRGIALVMIHPGFLKTDMTAHYSHFYEEFGAVDPQEAVGPILTAVTNVYLNIYTTPLISLSISFYCLLYCGIFSLCGS